MKLRDELYNEGGPFWRYVCESCHPPYISQSGTHARMSLVQRIHWHRHRVGLAGIYHRPRGA